MANVGSWVYAPSNNYPQKVATALAENLSILGCKYTPVMYLGYQIVNGTNHAVLAEQTVLSGEDTNNAVILVLNEKPGSLDVSLVRVVTLLEGSPRNTVGGVDVDVTTDIPVEEEELFNVRTKEIVGCEYDDVALLGSQVVNGVDFIYLATCKTVTLEPVYKLAVVTLNTLSETIKVEPIFEESPAYFFVNSGNGYEALSKPLGEWP